MLKFFYNGIKDNGGKLQLASYSDDSYRRERDGVITIYARHYRSFSAGIRAAFTVENNTEIQSDYFEQDRIRVAPTHPLYPEVLQACEAKKIHDQKRWAKRQPAEVQA